MGIRVALAVKFSQDQMLVVDDFNKWSSRSVFGNGGIKEASSLVGIREGGLGDAKEGKEFQGNEVKDISTASESQESNTTIESDTQDSNTSTTFEEPTVTLQLQKSHLKSHLKLFPLSSPKIYFIHSGPAPSTLLSLSNEFTNKKRIFTEINGKVQVKREREAEILVTGMEYVSVGALLGFDVVVMDKGAVEYFEEKYAEK